MNGAAQAVPVHYEAASPSAHLPLGIPQHLIIGDLDQAVQVEHNTSYVTTARQLGDAVQYTILPNTGHFEIVAPGTTVWPTVEEAILTLIHRRP